MTNLQQPMMFSNSSLLITLEYPPDIGGISVYYYNFSKKRGVRVLHLKLKRHRFSWINFVKKVSNEIERDNINNLIVGQILPLGYIALLFRLFKNIKYSVFIHGLDVLNNKLSFWKKFWIRVILLFSDNIITNSYFVKSRILKEYKVKERKVNVLHPLIDIESIESYVLRDLGASYRNSKVILSVGRLVERKGFDMVIRALSYLKVKSSICKKECPFRDNGVCSKHKIVYDFKYLIIGDGPYKNILKKLVKKYNLQDNVVFLGSVQHPLLYSYYNICDLFIMPSREINGDVEGFGIVFLEAGVFKKPVIGGRSGGVGEAVLDKVTGILVDPNDVLDISQAIIRILTDKDLAIKLGLNNYNRVKKKFSL